MYVSCSTLCFARRPLEEALRSICDLEFTKADIAIGSRGPHVTPEEVAADPGQVAHRIRAAAPVVAGAVRFESEAEDFGEYKRQLGAVCQFARLAAAPTVTIAPSPNTTPLEAEAERLHRLLRIAQAEGIILCLPTWIGTTTELPENAARLCEWVPGLGLTLDPSHYLIGPNDGAPFDAVYPHVCHVHFRDTRRPNDLQVQVGQGQIEYGRIITHLERYGYNRLLTVDIHDIPDAPYVMETEVRKLKFLLESLI